MAHNWFLQIDGQSWIELHSFEMTGDSAFSVSAPLTAVLGTCSGNYIFRAKVALRAEGLPGTYLQYNFTNLCMTFGQLSDLDGTPMKTIWFTFEQVQISYMSPSKIVGWNQAMHIQFQVIGSPTPMPVVFRVRGK
jgi:hypothetical protein